MFASNSDSQAAADQLISEFQYRVTSQYSEFFLNTETTEKNRNVLAVCTSLPECKIRYLSHSSNLILIGNLKTREGKPVQLAADRLLLLMFL